MTENRRTRSVARRTVDFFGETLHRCVHHGIDTQSAALAFYTLVSLAPVLLVVGTIARRFFGEGRVQVEIVRQFQAVMGPEAGLVVAGILEKAAGPGAGAGPIGITGIVTFVLGATAVFIQLQEALNRVWEVAPRPGPMFRSLLTKRFLSFGLVLSFGFLLLVSLTLSAGLVAFTDYLTARIPVPVPLITFANEVLSFLVLAVLIALVYKVLPDAKLNWEDVGIGSILTSILFSVGKWLIGFYLGRATMAAQFGVAGSLVVLLLWVYYESFILLFGAEVTAVYSSLYGKHRVTPEPGATSAHVGSEGA